MDKNSAPNSTEEKDEGSPSNSKEQEDGTGSKEQDPSIQLGSPTLAYGLPPQSLTTGLLPSALLRSSSSSMIPISTNQDKRNLSAGSGLEHYMESATGNQNHLPRTRNAMKYTPIRRIHPSARCGASKSSEPEKFEGIPSSFTRKEDGMGSKEDELDAQGSHLNANFAYSSSETGFSGVRYVVDNSGIDPSMPVDYPRLTNSLQDQSFQLGGAQDGNHGSHIVPLVEDTKKRKLNLYTHSTTVNKPVLRREHGHIWHSTSSVYEFQTHKGKTRRYYRCKNCKVRIKVVEDTKTGEKTVTSMSGTVEDQKLCPGRTIDEDLPTTMDTPQDLWSDKCSQIIHNTIESRETASTLDVSEDGYKWLEIGNVPVKGSSHHRFDFQCAHDGCRAMRCTHRSDEDATYVMVSYTGKHNHPPEKNNHHE